MHFDSLTTVEAGSHEKRIGLGRQMIVQVGGWANAYEANANARLIAAAPDLLAAVQLGLSPTSCESADAVIALARAAVAKALGGFSSR